MLLLLACSFPRVPVSEGTLPGAGQDPWATLDEPGPLTHSVHVSATWEAKASGLVNLDHPDAVDIDDHTVRIVLPIHVLSHPEHGNVFFDTGVPEELPARGLARLATRSAQIEKTMGQVIDEVGPPARVFISHLHADHVLGLPEVPRGTPVAIGPGELDVRGHGLGLLRRSLRVVFDGHELTELRFDGERDGFLGVQDVWGDGSLFVLYTPGHTPGSISLVARTTEGPMLLTGDTVHTLWGWEHAVESGGFTLDQAQQADSIARLKALDAQHPMRVWVGHETDGQGTGIVLPAP